ncbi:hypothetical protein OSTOST_17185, partial [Ostertagia ostertagi]
MRPSSDPSGCCIELREMAVNNQTATAGSGSLHKQDSSEVPKWIPPKLPPSYEAMVDVSSEKPIGARALPAWCCIVKIREDHIICFAPIPGVHKILIASDLI